MSCWPPDYSPTELLDFCKVDAYDWRNDSSYTTQQILALIAIEKDPSELVEKLNRLIKEHAKISIGRSLERLTTIANIGPEFKGGLDGVDALTYHLSGHICTEAIKALNKVMERFEVSRK